MTFERLIILDIKKNINISKKNYHYINLSTGILSFYNSKEILIKKYQKKYYKFYKNLLIKKLIVSTNNNKSIFLNESEIFNLRNDKSNFLNKIINILVLKKIFYKKKNKIKLITDDNILYNILRENNYFDVVYYGPKKKIENIFPLIKIFKFYIKSLLVVSYLKIFKKFNFADKYKDLCISIFPNFYNKKKEKFFNDKNFLKVNFILGDETQSSFSLKKIYNNRNYIRNKDILNVEQFINIKDIFICILKAPSIYLKSIKKFHQKIIISNIDFSIYFKIYLKSSLVNRLKLEIYNKALKKLLNKFSKIKNFHYYMFEYSFGFFLTRFFKENFSQLKLIGYQHGIFSDRLMWLDVILQSNMSDDYTPNKIVAYNKYCSNDYKRIFGNTRIILNNKKKPSKVAKSCILSSTNAFKVKKILVLAGTHDIGEIFYALNKKFKEQKKIIFFFKLHPKNKFRIIEDKQFKIIKSINNMKFNEVIISPTSTLVYDFIYLKKFFKVIDIDYKHNLISSKIRNIQFFSI